MVQVDRTSEPVQAWLIDTSPELDQCVETDRREDQQPALTCDDVRQSDLGAIAGLA